MGFFGQIYDNNTEYRVFYCAKPHDCGRSRPQRIRRPPPDHPQEPRPHEPPPRKKEKTATGVAVAIFL